MGLNPDKLAAIRAKLSAPQSTPVTPIIEIKKEEANANQQFNPPPAQSESSGKNAISSAIVKLQASQATAAQASQSSLQGAQSKSDDVQDAGQIKLQQVVDSINSLQEAIHTAHPRMPTLLQDIWSTLHSYPECVTLLEEHQMAVIVSGLEKVVDTDLAAITLKSAVKGTKKTGPVSNASLGF